MVAASLSLLSAALADRQLSHFVLISGDSYPIKPREQFRQLVMRPVEQIDFSFIPPEHSFHARIAKTFLPDSRVGTFENRDGDPTVQRFLTGDTLAAFDRIRRVFEMTFFQAIVVNFRAI